eukprot:8407191-Pyramimonas_sp.AAC.1
MVLYSQHIYRQRYQYIVRPFDVRIADDTSIDGWISSSVYSVIANTIRRQPQTEGFINPGRWSHTYDCYGLFCSMRVAVSGRPGYVSSQDTSQQLSAECYQFSYRCT